MCTAPADGTSFLPLNPTDEPRTDVSATSALAEQPGHEQEVAGAGEQHRGSRKERVAQGVANPAKALVIATLALREHRDDLPRPSLVGLGVVEPRQLGRWHQETFPAVTAGQYSRNDIQCQLATRRSDAWGRCGCDPARRAAPRH